MGSESGGLLKKAMRSPAGILEAAYFAGLVLFVVLNVFGMALPLDPYSVFLPLVYYVVVAPFYAGAFFWGNIAWEGRHAVLRKDEKIRKINEAVIFFITVQIGIALVFLFFLYLAVLVFTMPGASGGSAYMEGLSFGDFFERFLDRIAMLDIWNGASLAIAAVFHAPRLWKVYRYHAGGSWNATVRKEVEGLLAQPISIIKSLVYCALLPIVLPIYLVNRAFKGRSETFRASAFGLIIAALIIVSLTGPFSEAIKAFIQWDYFVWTSTLMVAYFSLRSIFNILDIGNKAGKK